MGFIEELRRQKQQRDADAQRAVDESRRAQNLRRQQEEARKLAEEQRNARITEERELSTKFLKQSEFPRMVQDLMGLVGGMVLLNSPIKLTRIKYDWGYVSQPEDRVSSAYDRLPISDEELEPNPGLSLIWNPDSTYWHHWQNTFKAIVIQCDSRGTIRINKSNEDLILPLDAWRNNAPLQEDYLGRAYSNPRVFYQYIRRLKDTDIPYDEPHGS